MENRNTQKLDHDPLQCSCASVLESVLQAFFSPAGRWGEGVVEEVVMMVLLGGAWLSLK